MNARTLVGGPLCGQEVKSGPSSPVIWCGPGCAPRSIPDEVRKHPYRLLPGPAGASSREAYIYEGHRVRRCECGALVRESESCYLCGARLEA